MFDVEIKKVSTEIPMTPCKYSKKRHLHTLNGRGKLVSAMLWWEKAAEEKSLFRL